MKMFLFLSSFILLTGTAAADIYLDIGESTHVGREQIFCGVKEQSPSVYRCSMKICIDPFGKESSDEWMCKKATSYTMETRSAIGKDKDSLYQELSSLGVFDSNSYSCEEI